MASVIWITFGLGALAFGGYRANAAGWADVWVNGAILGGAVGIVVGILNIISLKRMARKTESYALQGHMLGSFGLKLIGAIVIALVVQIAEGEAGPWAELEAAVMAYMAVVFFIFAIQGTLLEAATGRGDAEKRHSSEPKGH